MAPRDEVGSSAVELSRTLEHEALASADEMPRERLFAQGIQALSDT